MLFRSVSDPRSSLYGAHLTKEEVRERYIIFRSGKLLTMFRGQAEAFVAPTSETVEKVNEWLKENGVTATPLTDAGDWLSIQIPVSKANEMLDADFSLFTHPSTNKGTVRTLSYSIPDSLKGHIDLIHPTVR